jgi:hypothetical protein
MQMMCWLAAVVCVFGGLYVSSEPRHSATWAAAGIIAALAFMVGAGLLSLLRDIAGALRAADTRPALRSPFDPPPP